MKERQSGMKVYFITLIQHLYFKTRRINVIIDFHFEDKTTRKRRKIIKYSSNESQSVDLIQKRELHKCKEILMPLTLTATVRNVSVG